MEARRITTRILPVLIAIFVGLSFSFVDPEPSSALSKPGKPKITSIKAVSSSSVKLIWKKAKGAKGYAVYRNGKLIKRVKTKTYTDKKLKANTKYTYKVRAYKTFKQEKWFNKKTGKWQSKKPPKKDRGSKKKVTCYKYGKYSKAKKVTTPKKAGSVTKPANITYSWGIEDGSPRYIVLNLKWNKVKNADHYYVYTSDDERWWADGPSFKGLPLKSTDKASKLAISAVNSAGKEGPKAWITIPKREAKYTYKVRFFNQPYSLMDAPFYIQTDNPDPENFEVNFYDSKGRKIPIFFVSGYDYFDVPCGYKEQPKVDGGYVITVERLQAGTVTVKIKEALKGRKIALNEETNYMKSSAF